MIADWVQFISPVPAARPIIRQRYGDRDVADSPLVFPTLAPNAESVTSRLYTYPSFSTPLEERRWNELFGALI